MEIFPVVEAGLWRVSGIRVATQLLTQQPEYQVSVCACLPGAYIHTHKHCLFIFVFVYLYVCLSNCLFEY